jgi:hypothetical protein
MDIWGLSEKKAITYSARYGELLNEARTLPADFFSILLDSVGS